MHLYRILFPRRETGSTCRVGEHRCAGISPMASVWLRVPHLLWAFRFSFYFPANDCCFACVSFHILLLLFLPALPSIPRTFPFVPYFPLKSCWACPFQISPTAYFPTSLYTFLLCTSFLYFPLFPYFPCLSRTFPPKILLSMPAPGPSSSALPSLYPSRAVDVFDLLRSGIWLIWRIVPLIVLLLKAGVWNMSLSKIKFLKTDFNALWLCVQPFWKSWRSSENHKDIDGISEG